MPCTAQEVPHSVDYEAGTPPEETQELPAQGMDNSLLDAELNDCRVEMVPLDAIYVESELQEDDLVNALAYSIGLIGLQNPVCVMENDIADHPARYRLVSGRKRLAAFLKLQRTTIPAHILTYAEIDSEKDVRKALATTEENLVRKHYSLIELCELIGQSKAMYERIHPETKQGEASKPKHSVPESFPKPLAYLDVTAQQLGKSRGTVWKYLSIYKKLIQGHPDAFAELKQCDHPILGRIEDLLEVAQSDDILDGCPGWTMSELEMTPCRHCRYEAYPIVKTKKSENYDSLLDGRTEIYRRWCPISQCLMLPPLIVAHKALG